VPFALEGLLINERPSEQRLHVFVNVRNPGEFRTVGRVNTLLGTEANRSASHRGLTGLPFTFQLSRRRPGGSKVMLTHALVGGSMAKRGLIYEPCGKLTRYN
jgi:hypothetical protein